MVIEKSRDENLDNILHFNGTKFQREKITWQDKDGSDETIRIYATDSMLDVLIDKNYSQYFIDGTFKCIPKGGNI